MQGCVFSSPQSDYFFLAIFLAGAFFAAFLAGAFFAAAFAISMSPVSVEFPHESLVRKKALLFFNALVDSQIENSREYFGCCRLSVAINPHIQPLAPSRFSRRVNECRSSACDRPTNPRHAHAADGSARAQ